MTEKQSEIILVHGIKKLGGRAYKFTSPGNAGVPDRIIVLHGRTIFVEMKSERGKLSALQQLQIARLKSLDQEVYVLYGQRQTRAFLEKLRKELESGRDI